MLWPKKIHTRNLTTKKNSCGSKIPLSPHNFANGPPLSRPLLFLLLKMKTIETECIKMGDSSLRASSPIWASETRVLARLASLAQIGELARRLGRFEN